MFVTINDTTLYYDVRENLGKPALVFINSLGTDSRIWNSVINTLGSRYHIITLDKRGHGLSGPVSGQCTMRQYAEDISALLDHLDIHKTYVCGISIGGMIAQELYHLNPDRILGMVLSNTGLKIGDDETWNARINGIRASGLPSLAKGVMERWFSSGYLQEKQDEISAYQRMFSSTSPEGYIAACEALRDTDLRDKAGSINIPVTCIASDGDISTPVQMVTELSDALPNSNLVTIAGAGHLPCIEKSEMFAHILKEALRSEINGHDYLDLGMTVRRSVLGNAHVDQMEARKTDFDIPFQDFITRSAWGSVWGRNELTRRERSMLTIALLAALGHDEELAMHVRATLNTGATKEDVREVLLHTAVYAGVPVANNAIRIAKEVFSTISNTKDGEA